MAKSKGPQPIERVRERLEAWRKGRKPRSRIPERLWKAAAELARSYGVHKVARALHLDYYNLKDRRDGIVNLNEGSNQDAASFIEVMPNKASYSGECVIELESSKGAKMRIHFKGEGVPQATALCAEFLKNGR